MQLGVNFTPSAALGLGYNQDAIRALRPEIVRHVILDTSNLLAWFDEARRAGIRVLWVIPPELIGVGASRYAARCIASRAVDITAGVEIGHAPWGFNTAPEDFAAQFFMVSEHARAGNPEHAFPVIAGVGFDGSSLAARWLKRFLWFVEHGAHLDQAAAAVGVHAVEPSRPFRRRQWARLERTVDDAVGLPLAFTRVGWHVGQPLSRVRQAIEFTRDYWELLDNSRDPNVEPPAVARAVTRQIRDRWILNAARDAQALGASHFILEAPALGSDQGHAWPLYDQETQRADQLWTVLNWRDSRARAAKLSPIT